ncbi:MAG TPA: hypothetical protein VJ850_08915 [Candidatus Limnocylindrales bacterium]|nr:hypothetical protein [Candidatus Limnocylindrales bacterium]
MPTMPSNLQRTASAKVSDVLVEIEMQRNPMPAGDVSWVKAKLTNVGSGDLHWLHDGCATIVGLGGLSEVGWPIGITHDEQLQMFKVYAFGTNHLDPPPVAYASFVPKDMLGRGGYGCADIGITETIHPGETRSETRWWSGYDSRSGFLPPGGPLTLKVRADLLWRGKEPGDIVHDGIRVDFEVPAWVTPKDGLARPSPGEIIDAALADADFAAYVRGQDIGTGRDVIAWYQPDRDVWEIGILPWYESDPPRIHGVLVDAVTRRILGVLDRPWDKATDRFP